MAIIPCDNYNELTVDRCITRAVDALGGVDAFVPPKAQVVLKPNLCLAEPFDKHVTTHPQVVRSIMKLFATKNADIVIGDNPVGDANVTRVDHIFAISGMEKALRGFSYQRSLLQNNLIQLINTIDGQTYPFYVSNDVMQADLLINIPKFKTHTLTLFSGCVKNLFGLLEIQSVFFIVSCLKGKNSVNFYWEFMKKFVLDFILWMQSSAWKETAPERRGYNES